MAGSTPSRQADLAGAIADYSRVSTDDQRERATIETQRTKIAEYCEKHGIAASHSYSDDGWSGRRFHLHQRPDGKRLLTDAESQHFQTLIVYRVDRLGRGRKLLSAIDTLESVGFRTIVSVTEQVFDLRNPTDIFLLTMLSGVSGYEAESTLQRSSDATLRLAQEGQWLGGIVPYGYRVVGLKRAARLVPSEEPIPGRDDGLSEASVIRLIFVLVVERRWTTQRVADHLNALGVPPAYVRDKRLAIHQEATALHGKRTTRVQGIWRAGRILNMIHNTTYYGVHQYGKRSNNTDDAGQSVHAVISRPVPALVDELTWQRAQDVLQDHVILDNKKTKYTYLLKGILKCGQCGLTYSGAPMNSRRLNTRQTEKMKAGDTRYDRGEPIIYYRCNGAAQFRGLYGAKGQRCPSKGINGEKLEAKVWADVENYIRHPDKIIEEITAQLDDRENKANVLRDKIADQKLTLAHKAEERQSILTLYRRGRIDDQALDRQLDEITQEERDLQRNVTELQSALTALLQVEETLGATTGLLQMLNKWLDVSPDQKEDEPHIRTITPEQKRKLITMLVKNIVVDTIPPEGSPPEPHEWSNPAYRDWRKRSRTRVRIIYHFTPPSPTLNNSASPGDDGVSITNDHTGARVGISYGDHTRDLITAQLAPFMDRMRSVLASRER